MRSMAAPELDTPASNGIAHNIQGNSNQPGTYAGVTTKMLPAFVCIEKSILCDIFSHISVAHRCQYKTKDWRPMDTRDLVEFIQVRTKANNGFFVKCDHRREEMHVAN